MDYPVPNRQAGNHLTINKHPQQRISGVNRRIGILRGSMPIIISIPPFLNLITIFLLDQLEIFGNRRDSITPEEFKAYFDGFNEKEASAYMFLAMTPAEANMKGKLTPVQSKRFNSLKHYLD